MSNTHIPERGNYPYIIHADPLWDSEPLYPTHTHGLTEIGMPEFIMDPLAFGGDGNAGRINYSFDLVDGDDYVLMDAYYRDGVRW